MHISAVIPTYNRAHSIGRAVKSVLEQTSPVDELIVVDDGSTDRTAEAIAEFGPRVRYIQQENSGVSAARTRGIVESKSEWIAFLDSDDEWLPEKIALQREAILKCPDAALCYCASLWCFAGETKTLAHCPPVDKLWPGFRFKNQFPLSGVLIRKSAFEEIGGFDKRLRGPDCEDWDLFVRLAAQYRLTCIDTPALNYYESPDSGSLKEEILLPATLSIVESSLLINLRGIERAIWRQRIKSVLYYRAAVSARSGKRPAGRLLMRSILYWPSPLFEPKRFKTMLLIAVRK
jgi:glycosyltransferase involved in cell wall biosynthesis